MRTEPIIYTVIFCGALAGAMLHFAGHNGKMQDRADPEMAMTAKQPDPSGKPNTTTLYKTNYSMPSEISEALAKIWIDQARRKRENPEIADIVQNQTVEECELPGRMRMEDGNCWRPEVWKRLHP